MTSKVGNKKPQRSSAEENDETGEAQSARCRVMCLVPEAPTVVRHREQFIRFGTVKIDDQVYHVSEPILPEIADQLVNLGVFAPFKLTDEYGNLADVAIGATIQTPEAREAPGTINQAGKENEATNSPSVVRRDLERRIKDGKATLRRLGIKSNFWRRLIPLVKWTPSGAYIDAPEHVERALIVELGERYRALSRPIGPPKRDELKTEMERLEAMGVGRETAFSAAHAVILQKRMAEQERPAQFDRETPAWEAVTSMAIAAAASRCPSPEAISGAGMYFEELDKARLYDTERTLRRHEKARADRAKAHLHEARDKLDQAETELLARKREIQARKRTEAKRQRLGGEGKRGKRLRHVELIRRALGQAPAGSPDDVLDVLQDPDTLNEIMHAEPVILLATRDDYNGVYPVEIERDDESRRGQITRVWFRFADGESRFFSGKRLSNLVSELKNAPNT